MLPEGQRVVAPPHAEAVSVDAATAAVDRILASTESAVSSIVRRTEYEVQGMAAEVDARIAHEAIERTARLTQLRRELTERAAILAVHFDAILSELDTVEAALAPGTGRVSQEPVDPHVAAVKMTLRERQRISVAYEDPVSPAGVVDQVSTSTSPPPVPEARRRWWQLWSREAA